VLLPPHIPVFGLDAPGTGGFIEFFRLRPSDAVSPADSASVR
jgi:hypothetical protein